MANIGSLAVQLSLDATLFTSGLDRSSKEAQQFVSTITKTFSGIGAGLAAAEGIGGFGSKLYSGFKAGLNEIVEQGKEAKRLGIGLEELAGINRLLGSDAEAGAHALQHFAAHVSQAAAGSAEAAKPFRQLGLDFKELAGLSLDKSLGKTLDVVNQLKAIDQTNVATELFGGREGPKIVADIENGSKSIAESVAIIRSHGGISLDSKGAIESQRAIEEMEKSWQRIALKLTSDVAPSAEKIADSFSAAAGSAAALYKTLAKSQPGQALGIGAINFSNFAFAAFASGLGMTNRLIGGGAGGDGEKKPDALGVTRDLDNTIDFTAAIDKLDVKLHEQIATFGMVAEAAERFKLAHDGATDAQLKGIDAGIAELTAMRNLDESVGHGATSLQKWKDKIGQLNELHRAGKIVAGFTAEWEKLAKAFDHNLAADFERIADSVRTPLQKLKDQMGELDHLRLVGDVNGNKLTKDQYALALVDEFKKIAPSPLEHHAPAALMEGSLQAHSAEVAWERQGNQQSAIDQIKDIFRELKEQERQQLEEAKKLVAAMNGVKDRLSGNNPF